MPIWMVFIMRVSRKADFYQFLHLFALAVCLALIAYSGDAAIPGIEIDYVNCDLSEGFYFLNAHMSVELSEESKKALVHGIPLRFDIEIKIIEKRDWLWDKTIFSNMIIYRLSYQPLTNYYIVTNISNGRRQQFFNLDEVLDYLGNIENHKLFEFERFPVNRNYAGLLRARLNIKALPTPLKPLAYISSQWHLASQWIEWRLE